MNQKGIVSTFLIYGIIIIILIITVITVGMKTFTPLRDAIANTGCDMVLVKDLISETCNLNEIKIQKQKSESKLENLSPALETFIDNYNKCSNSSDTNCLCQNMALNLNKDEYLEISNLKYNTAFSLFNLGEDVEKSFTTVKIPLLFFDVSKELITDTTPPTFIKSSFFNSQKFKYYPSEIITEGKYSEIYLTSNGNYLPISASEGFIYYKFNDEIGIIAGKLSGRKLIFPYNKIEYKNIISKIPHCS